MSAIHKIILGTVQFGLDYGINNSTGKPGQETVNEILKAAYKAGICTLDTAEAYGNAHDIIGNFHHEYPDYTFNIITKLPHDLKEDLNQKLELYLAQLHVLSLEALMFHSFKTYKDHLSEVDALVNLKNNGKLKQIGVSIYTNDEMSEVIEDDRVDLIQLPFNLFDNQVHRGEMINSAKEKGKIIHTRSAFLQGLFFKDVNSELPIVKKVKDELVQINQLVKSSGISMFNIALNYAVQQPNIDNVLIGVDSKDQLLENLTAIQMPITETLINEINTIHIANTDLLNPSLWN